MVLADVVQGVWGIRWDYKRDGAASDAVVSNTTVLWRVNIQDRSGFDPERVAISRDGEGVSGAALKDERGVGGAVDDVSIIILAGDSEGDRA